MRILLLGNNVLQTALEAQGNEVVSCGHTKGVDINLPARWFTIESILRRQEIKKPDLILFCTTDEPRFIPVDIHTVTQPRVLWALATTGGYHRLKELARLFDRVFVSQIEYCRRLALDGLTDVEWLPPVAQGGTPVQNRKRRHLLTIVAPRDGTSRRRADILSGNLAELFKVNRIDIAADKEESQALNAVYSDSDIVIHCLPRHILSSGILQAMRNGAVVLAERTSNGLEELFKDRHQLFFFNEMNLMSSIELVLENEHTRRLITARALREVDLKHSAIARAAQLSAYLHQFLENEPLLNAEHHLGKLLLRTGMLVDPPGEALGRAVAVLQEAADSSLLPADTWLQTAICRAEAGEPYAALEAINHSLELDSSYYHTHFIAAALYRQLCDSYNAAQCYIEGAKCITLDNTGNGVRLMEKVEQEQYDSEFYHLLGDIYRINGRGYQDGLAEQREPVVPLFGIHYYRLALAEDSGDYLALQALGGLFLEHNLPEQAVEAYSAAVKLDPYNPECRYDLGLARFRQLQRGEGLTDIAQAFVLDNRPPRMQEIESLQLEEAEWDFFWGEVLADEMKYEASEKRMLKAIAQANQASYFTLRLGQIYYDCGSYEEALAAFREYLRRLPGSGRAYALMGFTYLQLKHTELALWCLKRSLSLDGSNGVVKKVRDRLLTMNGKVR